MQSSNRPSLRQERGLRDRRGRSGLQIAHDALRSSWRDATTSELILYDWDAATVLGDPLPSAGPPMGRTRASPIDSMKRRSMQPAATRSRVRSGRRRRRPVGQWLAARETRDGCAPGVRGRPSSDRRRRPGRTRSRREQRVHGRDRRRLRPPPSLRAAMGPEACAIRRLGSGARSVQTHVLAVFGPGELTHRGVDLRGDSAGWRILGRHERADDVEARVREHPGDTSAGRLRGVAAALLGCHDVIADFGITWSSTG